MNVSIGAEVKTLVDTTAVTETYRAGYVPDSAAFPYASFLDPVSDAVALEGDAQTLGRRRLLQVDLWQREAAFDPALVDAVVQAIDGAKIASAFRLKVTDVQGLPPDPGDQADIIHHALTVSAARLS